MAEAPYLFVLGSFVAACSAHVARFPRPGESATATAFTVEAGGKGLNLAVGARRLGAAVDGLIAIGDDIFGRMAVPALVRADLPVGMLRPCAGPTGAGIGFIDASGETSLAIFSGANAMLGADHVRAAAERIARATFVLAQFEISDAPIVEAFRLARASGATTILNPSPFRPLSLEILRHTSILVVNDGEAGALAAEVGTPLAEALFARGVRRVIVTHGPKGATAHAPADTWIQPGFVVAAVDTLGAGDAFTAGLAASLLEGRPFPDGLRRAAACGALAACGIGVFDALPSRDALERFLADRPNEAGSHTHDVRL